MTVSDLQQEPTEIPLVQWIVDYSFEPPQRRALIDFDVNTLISLVDVADAATFAPGAQTKLNAELIRDFGLRVIRELESRSLIDHEQWSATEHLAATE
jgi:hypothetical protein